MSLIKKSSVPKPVKKLIINLIKRSSDSQQIRSLMKPLLKDLAEKAGVSVSRTLKDVPNYSILTDSEELNEIKRWSLIRNDINDHLETLFIESALIQPKLIVELGVREGQSTFALERVAKLFDSVLVGVDVEDEVRRSSYEKRFFIKSDDIEFAKQFPSWCQAHHVEPSIDVLFIDTSHLYEHTLQEINSWFPLLSKKSKVFFHDSNLRDKFSRKDGSIGEGWNNDRGVIRAIEKYFNKSFNETVDFIDFRDGWLIKHYHLCNGLTILEKLDLPVTAAPASSTSQHSASLTV